VSVEVRCFGEQDVQEPTLRVKGYGAWAEAKKDTDPRFGGALDAVYRSLANGQGQPGCGTSYIPIPGTSNSPAF